MQLLVEAGRQDWATFFRINCAALFETALLLTADPDEAEASVAAVVNQIDVSTPPDESELANLQEKLARRAAQGFGQPASF